MIIQLQTRVVNIDVIPNISFIIRLNLNITLKKHIIS